MNIKKLEHQLNEAHKEYLKTISNVKSEEYKNARNIYLDLAEKYRKEYSKLIRRNSDEMGL